MSFNKILIVGNLGKDPELRYTPTGDPVCSFSVATNEKRKVNGQYQDHVTWFRVTLFGKKAEAASQYLVKGRQVYIEGRLRVDEWNDKDGKPRHTLEVAGSEMQFIGDKQESRAAAASSGGGAAQEPDDEDDNGVPF